MNFNVNEKESHLYNNLFSTINVISDLVNNKFFLYNLKVLTLLLYTISTIIQADMINVSFRYHENTYR